LAKQTEKRKSKKRRQPKRSRYTSAEAAALAIAMLVVSSDRALLERLIKLVLRAPNELIKNLAGFFIEQQGGSVAALLSGEPTTPASKAELLEIAKPVLKTATAFMSAAQLFDLYLIGNSQIPEDLVFAFYIIARMLVAKERKPSKVESMLIWDIALSLTRSSKIGSSYWQELERKGKVYLDSWLQEVKEKARKKFQTFVNQKKQIEKTADRSFNWLLAFLFNVEENA
jgi:hypothetical protein